MNRFRGEPVFIFFCGLVPVQESYLVATTLMEDKSV